MLEQQLADAVAKGAKVVVGGSRIDAAGNWFSPAVLTNTDHSMEVMREESFGPIIGIQKVNDDDEAVRLMNDTEYGLTAGVYTKDEQRARSLLSQLRAGFGLLELLRPRQPPASLERARALRGGTYAIDLRHRDIHAA